MRALSLIEELLQEETYKLSSTQLNLPPAHADYVMKWGRQMIPDEHVFYDDKGGLGRETEPHITVLYGLTEPEPSAKLMELIRKTPPFTVRLGAITFFENDDYDVVKFEVEGDELTALSDAIRVACPNENKYPKYVPHCTVAYVKHGSVPDLAGNYPFEQNPPIPAEFEVNEILFKPAGESGDPNRKVVHIPLNRHIKEAETPKDALRLKFITRPLPFGQVPWGYYFRTPTYELVKKEMNYEIGANAATTDLDAVRTLIFPDAYMCFPPRFTVNDITSYQGWERLENLNRETVYESLDEAENPKEVFRHFQDDPFVVYSYDAGNLYFLRMERRWGDWSYTWVSDQYMASHFRHRELAQMMMDRFYAGAEAARHNVKVGNLRQVRDAYNAGMLEAEDPKEFLRRLGQQRLWDVVTITWRDQYGKEHTTRYYELPKHLAREELEKNLKINRSPYTVQSVISVTTEMMVEAAETPKSVFRRVVWAEHPKCLIGKNKQSTAWSYWCQITNDPGFEWEWSPSPSHASVFNHPEHIDAVLAKMAQEAPEYQMKVIDRPEGAWRGYYHYESQEGPFDKLDFPTDASVLVAKLLDLELSTAKKKML